MFPVSGFFAFVWNGKRLNYVFIILFEKKIPKRETLGPVELVFKNKGRNYGHFERVKMEKRDKNWQKAFSKKVEVMTHRQKT